MPKQQKSIQLRPQPSSLGQTIKEGFSFGLGSAIAHRVVGSLFASTTPSVKQERSSQPEYVQCIKEGGIEDSCKQYYQA
jgi:hypothetical protein